MVIRSVHSILLTHKGFDFHKNHKAFKEKKLGTLGGVAKALTEKLMWQLSTKKIKKYVQTT